MNDELKVPKELQHLLEKRKRRGRRKEDLATGARTATAAFRTGPERRKRNRRRKGV